MSDKKAAAEVLIADFEVSARQVRDHRGLTYLTISADNWQAMRVRIRALAAADHRPLIAQAKAEGRAEALAEVEWRLVAQQPSALPSVSFGIDQALGVLREVRADLHAHEDPS